MQTITINQENAYFKLTTELGGQSYTLSFRWNGRAGQWVLDFGDGDGNVIAAGIRCVVSKLLLQPGATGYPPGYLLFVDTAGGGVDMGFADLGRRVQLYYVPADELAALQLEYLAAEEAASS